jgi:chemotaxis signal transduction protein
MSVVEDRYLIFRLGENAFVLSLEAVVEVVDPVADKLVFARNDPASGIVAAFDFRCARIPVVDPAVCLNIASQGATDRKRLIVLQGTEGRWAILVDAITELVSAISLQPCAMTLLLQQVTGRLYNQLRLHKGEVLIVFDPENYYGSLMGLV